MLTLAFKLSKENACFIAQLEVLPHLWSQKFLFREYGVSRTPFFAHRRRNIRPPSAIDQALRAARPKGRPRA